MHEVKLSSGAHNPFPERGAEGVFGVLLKLLPKLMIFSCPDVFCAHAAYHIHSTTSPEVLSLQQSVETGLQLGVFLQRHGIFSPVHHIHQGHDVVS